MALTRKQKAIILDLKNRFSKEYFESNVTVFEDFEDSNMDKRTVKIIKENFYQYLNTWVIPQFNDLLK